MSDSELAYHLFYMLLSFGIVYPPEELSLMGLTIEKLFDKYLGNEMHYFIKYHQRRTALNLFVHSCLPLIHFIIYIFMFPDDQNVSPLDLSAIYKRYFNKRLK